MCRYTKLLINITQQVGFFALFCPINTFNDRLSPNISINHSAEEFRSADGLFETYQVVRLIFLISVAFPRLIRLHGT